MTYYIFGSNERHIFVWWKKEEAQWLIDSCPVRRSMQVWEKKLPVRSQNQIIQALMVLVSRGMTVGTPDVVTGMRMVKNDEIDKILSPFERRNYQGYGKPIRVKP